MKRICMLTVVVVLFCSASGWAYSEDQHVDNSSNGDTAAIGVFFPYTKFYRDFAGLEDVGWGIGARAAFYTNNSIGIEMSAFQTRHNDPLGEELDFSGITFDIKARIPLARNTVYPYALAGIGRYVIRSDTGDVALRGNVDWNGINGYQVGFGIELFLTRNLAANAGFTRRRIEFDYGTPTGSDLIALTKTVDFGLILYFQ